MNPFILSILKERLLKLTGDSKIPLKIRMKLIKHFYMYLQTSINNNILKSSKIKQNLLKNEKILKNRNSVNNES